MKMHILGIILAFLAVIGSGVTVYLSSYALKVRTSWIKNVEKKKDAYLKIKDEPAKLRAELKKHQLEYHRVNYDWGKVFNNVAVNQGGVGVMVQGVGTAEGVRQGQVLHLFQPDGNQGTSYLGPVRVENVADGQFAASATWVVRPQDAASFRFGQGFRIRENVPTADLENFVKMQHSMSLKDVDLKDAKKWLDYAQNRDRKTAEDQLQFRINELHGDPAQADKKGLLPDYLVDGLVIAIENAEETRNVTLEEVHELRQKLQDVYDEIVEVQKKNEDLIQALPGSAPASAAPKADSLGKLSPNTKSNRS